MAQTGSVPYYNANAPGISPEQAALNITIQQLQTSMQQLAQTMKFTAGQILQATMNQVVAPSLQSMAEAQKYLVTQTAVQTGATYVTPGPGGVLGAGLAALGVLRARSLTGSETRYYASQDLATRMMMMNLAAGKVLEPLLYPLDLYTWVSGPITWLSISGLLANVHEANKAIEWNIKMGNLLMSRAPRLATSLQSTSIGGFGLSAAEIAKTTEGLQKFWRDYGSEKTRKFFEVALQYGYFDFAGSSKEIVSRMNKLLKHYKTAESSLRLSLEEYVSFMRDMQLNRASDMEIEFIMNQIHSNALMTGTSPRQMTALALRSWSLFRRYDWHAGAQSRAITTLSSSIAAAQAAASVSPIAGLALRRAGGTQNAAMQTVGATLQMLTKTPVGQTLMGYAYQGGGVFDLRRMLHAAQHINNITIPDDQLQNAIADIMQGNISLQGAYLLPFVNAFLVYSIYQKAGRLAAAQFAASHGILEDPTVSAIVGAPTPEAARKALEIAVARTGGNMTSGIVKTTAITTKTPWDYIKKKYKRVAYYVHAPGRWVANRIAEQERKTWNWITNLIKHKQLGFWVKKGMPDFMAKFGDQFLMYTQFTRNEIDQGLRMQLEKASGGDRRKEFLLFGYMSSIETIVRQRLGEGADPKDILKEIQPYMDAIETVAGDKSSALKQRLDIIRRNLGIQRREKSEYKHLHEQIKKIEKQAIHGKLSESDIPEPLRSLYKKIHSQYEDKVVADIKFITYAEEILTTLAEGNALPAGLKQLYGSNLLNLYYKLPKRDSLLDWLIRNAPYKPISGNIPPFSIPAYDKSAILLEAGGEADVGNQNLVSVLSDLKIAIDKLNSKLDKGKLKWE